jgi:hypothetical protein
MGESVLRYRAIEVEGEKLRIDYTVERSGILVVPSRGERRATLPIAALEGAEEIPVDALPVDIGPARPALPAGAPLELRVAATGARGRVGACEGPGALAAVVESRDGRDAGFRLVRDGGGPCLHSFRSAALYRDGTSWWVPPLMPVALAVDLALLPVQLVTLGPFLLLSE